MNDPQDLRDQPLVVEQDGERDWKLKEPLTYDHTTAEGRKTRYTVPPAEVTDFASVPRFFWWLIPRSGRHTKAAVIHDYLVRGGHGHGINSADDAREIPISRREADFVFRDALRDLQVPAFRRRAMWGAVRVGGKFSDSTFSEVLILILLTIGLIPIWAPGGLIVSLLLVLFWVYELVAFCLRWVTGKQTIRPPFRWYH